jgi:N-hydroxyarylamine O-acetyltransferase
MPGKEVIFLHGYAMSTETLPSLDLDAYLSRIGWAGERQAIVPVLEELHLAHATHIPFENLDILLGRPIRLDLESLQAKLVRGKRGGYCFEQNTLFAAVLEQIGFRVTRLAARVRLGSNRIAPRTHMLLEVGAEGKPWLADVGFGGGGPLKPLLLRSDQVVEQYGRRFRLLEAAGLWVLQSWQDGAWSDLYAFTREAQYPIDFEMANHFTSTYAESIFVRSMTAQLLTPTGQYILRNREFQVLRGDTTARRTITDDDTLLVILAEHFGLELPKGTRFRILDTV